MLLFKKQQEYLDEFRQSLQSSISDLQQQVSAINETVTCQDTQLTELSQTVKKSSQSLQKQEMALEDVMDALEEDRNQESLEQQRITELEEDRDALLAVIGEYQEMMWQVKSCAALQNELWEKQFAMIDERIRGRMAAAGLQPIDHVGGPVNYEQHQVIAVEDTADERLHGTVRQVFCPGCSYKGKVLRKGQVSSWKFTE